MKHVETAKVLVVDDDAERRRAWFSELSAAGFSVITLDFGGDPLERLRAGDIEAVVMSVVSADDSSVEITRRIKQDERLSSVPVIVVSTCADAVFRVATLSAGAEEFLLRPEESAELAARMRDLVRLRRAQPRARVEDRMPNRDPDPLEGYARFTLNALDALSAQIAVLDRDGTIVSGNEAWQRFIRETRCPLEVGQPYRAALIAALPDAQQLQDGVMAVCRAERRGFVLDYRFGSGEATRWFTARVTRFRDPSDSHVVVSHEDVTQEKKAQKELERVAREESREQAIHAQKMESIGRLAGGVAHDFNNLLTSIICFTRFVVDDMAQEDPRRADLVEVLKAADSAARLTNQLLAFSRRKPLQTVALDLNAALTSVGRVLRRTLGERVELVILPAEESLCVMCDAGQFDQLIFNLAVNAKDAMPDGGAITFKLGRTSWDGAEGLNAGDYVELLISDNGQPLSPEAAARAFEPFTTGKGDRSTGLGLATCYGIVQQAGGSIKIQNVVGGGTQFRVLLPRIEEPRRHEHSRAAVYVPVSLRGTALVVDDQPAILRTMARALSSAGLTVLEARSGEDAVALLATRQTLPELLVTDLVLPGMSGQRLVELLRERSPGLKVVLVSGYVGDELQQDVRTDENTGFVAKPFTGRQLTSRAAALLAAPAARGATSSGSS